MEFKNFRTLHHKYVTELLCSALNLYTTNVDKDILWETYLNSFPPGTNEIYVKKREYDCSCCRSFIKNFGNIVVEKNGKLYSIWGLETNDTTFQPVVNALDKMITSAQIEGVFVAKNPMFGTEYSRQHNDGKVVTWNHFYFKLPEQFLLRNSSTTVASVQGTHNTNKEVFERSLQQISVEALDTVLDLISQNSLYRGEEWKVTLEKFLVYKKQYDQLQNDKKNNWCWIKSTEAGPVVSRLKNHSIGTLLLDLSEDTDLEVAIRKYEVVVAPTNYKRPKAIFTQKMLDQARKTVEELGLVTALPRRFAKLSDITINDVLFADRNVNLKNNTSSVFEKLGSKIPISQKSYDKVEEISIDKFLEQVLPRSHSLEILLENKHLPNLLSLIAPQDPTAKTMFKWPNNFSWAYMGNIADSMKERVKQAGGKVDGVLRFSIQWNEDNDNRNDYDAHCIEPNGNHIYFGNKGSRHPSTGMLDVDITHPQNKKVAVENITWVDPSKMQEGVYELYLNCYAHRSGVSGFSAEVEYNGHIWQFEHRQNVRQGENIRVAKLRFDRQTGVQMIESLPSTRSSKTIWGLSTQQFVPVLAIMHSPNYWNGNTIGNRHTIFALKDCVNDSQPNGFFNEYLNEELMPHRKVFEALGREMKVEPSEEQLSGLGFSSTKRNEIIVKVTGSGIERTLKVTF